MHLGSSSSDIALLQMHYVNLFVQKHNHLVPAFIPDKLRDTDQDAHNVFTQVRTSQIIHQYLSQSLYNYAQYLKVYSQLAAQWKLPKLGFPTHTSCNLANGSVPFWMTTCWQLANNQPTTNRKPTNNQTTTDLQPTNNQPKTKRQLTYNQPTTNQQPNDNWPTTNQQPTDKSSLFHCPVAHQNSTLLVIAHDCLNAS